MSSTRLVALVLACAAGLVLAPAPASAQVVKPFKISGGGPVPDGLSLLGEPSPHFATGQATELGRYSCSALFSLLSPTTFSSAPYCVFTAANGDVLTCTYGDVSNGASGPGIVTLYPAGGGLLYAVFVAEFRPVPALCTGRFAKITEGSWIMYARSSPFGIDGARTTPFTYTWEGEGTFTYAKGK